MDEIGKTADATKAVAETVGKGLDLSREAGGFLARIFGGALEQWGERLADNQRAKRAINLIMLQKKFDAARADAGTDGPIKPLGLKVGIPLIEAASLEDEDALQERYAALLVNATNVDSEMEIQRSFVSILQDFGRMEAKLLDILCAAPLNPDGGAGVLTAGLPERYLGNSAEEKQLQPSDRVSLALWNLCRLGCIEPAGTWGGGSTVSRATVTPLGRALYAACTVRKKGEKQEAQQFDDAERRLDTDWGIKWTGRTGPPIPVT